MSTSQQPTKKIQLFSLSPHITRTADEGVADLLILEENDIHLLFAALAAYRPLEDDEQQYEMLLESLEEILIRAGN